MAIAVKSFVTPSGNVPPVLSGAKFTGNFSNTAELTHGSGETCGPGVYRQYVKGEFRANGSLVTHYLCQKTGVTLSNAIYQEDGCPAGQGCTAYGHRACPGVWNNQYTPNQTEGCLYEMNDQPGFSNVVKKTKYVISLYFQGQIQNLSSSTTLANREWTVIGDTTPILEQEEVAMAGLQPEDRIVGVHISQNENGAAEAHIVIQREHGSPALDPYAVSFSLLDAEGVQVSPASPPVVYEVGNRSGATASIVVTLPSGAHAPVKAEINVAGAAQTHRIAVR